MNPAHDGGILRRPRMPLVPLRARLAALLLALPLAACRSTERLAAPPELAQLDPLPITLSESLRTWRTERAAVTRTRYRLGGVLAGLFAGRDGRAFLSPLREEFESAFDAARADYVARYELCVSLQLDGRLHELVAQGESRSDDDPAGAERAALAQCLGRLHAGARERLAQRAP